MFTIEQCIHWYDLEQQVRETTLLDQPDALPYASSDIELTDIPSHYFADDVQLVNNFLAPISATTRYVLRDNLAFQRELSNDLRQQGCDQLTLVGAVVLRNSNTGENSILVPPIIEATENDGLYVLDGAHRIVELAGSASKLITAIVVHGPTYPGYARPNRWQDVKVVDSVPKNPAEKKDYRTDYPGGYRALYRDFSHLGSSGLRST